MSSTRRLSPEQLREMLQRGDPAGEDHALTLEERRGVQDHVRSVASAPVRRPWRWVTLAAGACTVVALVVVAMGPWRWSGWPRGDTPVVTVSFRPAVDDPQPVRQLHLTGSNGTRIIWILNPDVPF
ncbi:MAG: hypothetical protein NT151_01015 [Acidobacteria bacterium]|nr:hypothetical protein [Acidobacteriota bacterium]